MAEKKYVIDNAELMAEWNWEKNDELGFDPKILTLGCYKKVWRTCSNGYECKLRQAVGIKAAVALFVEK